MINWMGDRVAWTRSRVVNFGPTFATRYIKVLAALDGQPYEQATFFKALVDQRLVADVDQSGTASDIAGRRAKRWGLCALFGEP